MFKTLCSPLGKDLRGDRAIRLLSGDMAGEKVDLEALLSRAKEQEREYDWLGAAGSYRNALEALPKDDFLRIGRTQEAVAYALFRGAMQAENIVEFKSRMSETEKQYERAKWSYAGASSQASSPQISRCEAMIAYIGFWQTSDVPTKQKKVGDAWSFAKNAMDSIGQNEVLELAKTFNELFPSAVFFLHSSDDQRVRRTTLSEAIAYGEKAASLLSDEENRDELAKVLTDLTGLIGAASLMSATSVDERYARYQTATEYWNRAMKLSEENAFVNRTFVELISKALITDVRESQRMVERQLDIVMKTRDRLLIGQTLGILAFLSAWQVMGKENPEDADTMLDKILRYVEEARRHFGAIGLVSPDYAGNVWVSSPSQPWYPGTQIFFEADPRRKRELAEKFLESARLESLAAEESGYPYVVAGAHYMIGIALEWLAKTEPSREHKARLLDEAIRYRIECSRLEDTFQPSMFWNRALLRCLIADTEQELAEVSDRNDTKSAYLDSSISHMREGLELFQVELTAPYLSAMYDATNFWSMSEEWLHYGRALRSRYELKGAREINVSSAAAFERAAELAGKSGWPSRVAESLWEAARTYDSLDEYLKASERFDGASEQYRIASEKITSLGQLYMDQSLYLKAWSEIEKAKYHHSRQEPTSAKEHYDKAAELHESTGKWSFLSDNYSAWAQVEHAEDLSKRERCKESIDAFKDASRLFKDSKSKMQEQLVRIEVNDEMQMVEKLIDASDSRRELCMARIALEEARLFDKGGDLGGASEKYRLAADMLGKIKQGLTGEQDRKEIELMITLSKAWRAMAMAEMEASPGSYAEAAQLFNVAKELSPSERAKYLAMGNSFFCRALQAGVIFSDTGNLAQHDVAADYLDSAGKYYLKAGVESASEYARASRLMFDAYVHMSKARKEEDPEKKTKLYSMAEKVLQASGSSYEKAGHSGRKEQMLKLLVKVKEDRELAMSLAEVFLAPDIVSTTMAFSSPAPTHETAVGLDRFEHADVRAKLIVKPKELLVDQDLSLEIELVNAGRGVAHLAKVDKVVPEGFEVAAEPEKYRVEDSYLNMKGRRLDALKTEDVRLSLKPKSKGQFTVKPRVMYLDESGEHKSFELEPVIVTVKELGISGWLKGSEKKR